MLKALQPEKVDLIWPKESTATGKAVDSLKTQPQNGFWVFSFRFQLYLK